MRALFTLLATVCLVIFATADQSIFSDELDTSWQSWSWASVSFANTSPVHSGKYSIAVTETGGYQALYLHHAAQASGTYEALVFYVNGGSTGGQNLQVQATLNGGSQVAYPIPPLSANQWTKVVVPLLGVGVNNEIAFDGFWLQGTTGSAQSTYYVDDISLETKPSAVASQTMYDYQLENQWSNASTAETNLTNTSPVYGSKDSISVTMTKTTDIFALGHSPVDATEYQTLSFYIFGGALGGQQLSVVATSSGVQQTPYSIPVLAKNAWQHIVIPIQSLGVGARGDLDGIVIQDASTKVPSTFYLDNISLSTEPSVNATATINVSTTTKTPISPLIYGINSTDFAHLGKGFQFTRLGGNRLTAYNWENNASNAGSDYYFQNDDLLGATNQAGWTGQTFVQASINNGATPLLTIPTAGYVAADKDGGGDVRNTPNYLAVRFRQSLAAKPGHNYIYPPDTTDAYVYEDEYVNFIKQFSTAAHPIMFQLDNEPDLWDSTHAEIHPNATTYAEILNNNRTFADAIKYVAPTALVFGPVNYGWEGYRTLQNAPDADGRDFMDFYLAGMKQAEANYKKRLLDVLDLHWYPEATGDGIRITGDSDSLGLSAARIQAPRSLWDPNYVENSWIAQSLGNKSIQLLLDTFGRINRYYPGTKLSFTEYNYGGSFAPSGAIAQADVLGIFGRYGVFASSNWGLGAGDTAMLAGFQSFINYDRKGSSFGSLGLAVSGETASQNSVYASLDGSNPNRLVLVVINKSIGLTPFKINLSGFTPTSAEAYEIFAGHFTSPAAFPVTIAEGQLQFNAQPLSVTTINVTASAP